MLIRFSLCFTILFTLIIPSANATTKLQNETDKISYSIGVNVGKNIKQEKFEINSDLFLQGVKDGIDNKSILSEEEIETIITSFQKKEIEKYQKELEKQAEENLIKGKKFLKENQSKPGIKTLSSGLQYKILKKGKGKKPTLEDVITVNYIGTLIDGKEFDNSYNRKTPTSFKLKQVIKGWQEGLQLINVGGKIQLFLPPELAYGSNPAGPLIGPNSVLIFEVELVEIKNPLQ